MRSTLNGATRTAVLIGGVFGFVYLAINAGSLPAPAALATRVTAVAAFAGLLALLRRVRVARPGETPARAGFGRGYWLVVAGEIVAGLAGVIALNGPVGAPQAVVAWVTLVVGVHFYALGAVWRLASYAWLATAVAACGAAGLALAAHGASTTAIATVAGIGPGAILLAASYARLLRGSPSRDHRAPAQRRRTATG
jgi:hypothetical protein